MSQNMCMDQCYMKINLLFLNLWYLVVDNLINTVNGKLKILKKDQNKNSSETKGRQDTAVTYT